jgi:predicted amidohydrolase YtcJ
MIKKLCLLVAFISNAAWAQNTVVINANVITIEKDQPFAQAFAFDNGRFTAVGTNEQILKLRTPSTIVLDLQGMTVTPGFNDAHLHPQAIFDENSPYYRVWLGGDRVKTISDLISALQRKAAITPPGKLISGYGYNDVLLGRHPNRYDLDKVSTTQPIIITHGSGHITVVNSFILREVGITKDTADPPGGALDRDHDGTPNGVIRESARELLSRGRHDQQERGSDWRIVMPHEEEIQGYLNCFRQYSARGITSAGIAGGSPSSFRLMQELRRSW